MKKNDKSSFTLIELVIVTSMMAVIALAIYTTFNNGIKIWQRANSAVLEEDLNIFFDKFGSDLRNCFNSGNIGFFGQKDTLEFATLVNSLRLQKRAIGKVTYSYDSANGSITREQLDSSGLYSGKGDPARELLKNVKSVELYYYFYANERNEYLWDDQWIAGKAPIAVRIELEIEHGNETSRYTKTVSVPVGG